MQVTKEEVQQIAKKLRLEQLKHMGNQIAQLENQVKSLKDQLQYAENSS